MDEGIGRGGNFSLGVTCVVGLFVIGVGGVTWVGLWVTESG
jgi:hypothetical protein